MMLPPTTAAILSSVCFGPVFAESMVRRVCVFAEAIDIDKQIPKMANPIFLMYCSYTK